MRAILRRTSKRGTFAGKSTGKELIELSPFEQKIFNYLGLGLGTTAGAAGVIGGTGYFTGAGGSFLGGMEPEENVRRQFTNQLIAQYIRQETEGLKQLLVKAGVNPAEIQDINFRTEVGRNRAIDSEKMKNFLNKYSAGGYTDDSFLVRNIGNSPYKDNISTLGAFSEIAKIQHLRNLENNNRKRRNALDLIRRADDPNFIGPRASQNNNR